VPASSTTGPASAPQSAQRLAVVTYPLHRRSISSPSPTPTVSVVIVNWNGLHYLQDCLTSLRACSERLEIIVVDNASTDGSIEYLKQQADVQLITNSSNLGFAEGNNLGMRQATGDFVLLLNNDTIVERNFLAPLLQAMADPHVGACQCKTLTPTDPPMIDAYGSCMTWTGFLLHHKYGQPDVPATPPFEIFAAKAAAFLLRRAALDDAGDFDPDFFAYLEDSDLSWRLWLAGWKIMCVPESVVFHVAGATARKLPSEVVMFHSYKNRIAMLVKNLSPGGLVRIVPVHVALTLVLAVVYAGWWKLPQARGIARALAWNAAHASDTVLKRRHVRGSIRKGSDRELSKRMMCSIRISWFYYALTGLENYRE